MYSEHPSLQAIGFADPPARLGLVYLGHVSEFFPLKPVVEARLYAGIPLFINLFQASNTVAAYRVLQDLQKIYQTQEKKIPPGYQVN